MSSPPPPQPPPSTKPKRTLGGKESTGGPAYNTAQSEELADKELSRILIERIGLSPEDINVDPMIIQDITMSLARAKRIVDKMDSRSKPLNVATAGQQVIDTLADHRNEALMVINRCSDVIADIWRQHKPLLSSLRRALGPTDYQAYLQLLDPQLQLEAQKLLGQTSPTTSPKKISKRNRPINNTRCPADDNPGNSGTQPASLFKSVGVLDVVHQECVTPRRSDPFQPFVTPRPSRADSLTSLHSSQSRMSGRSRASTTDGDNEAFTEVTALFKPQYIVAGTPKKRNLLNLQDLQGFPLPATLDAASVRDLLFNASTTRELEHLCYLLLVTDRDYNKSLKELFTAEAFEYLSMQLSFELDQRKEFIWVDEAIQSMEFLNICEQETPQLYKNLQRLIKAHKLRPSNKFLCQEPNYHRLENEFNKLLSSAAERRILPLHLLVHPNAPDYVRILMVANTIAQPTFANVTNSNYQPSPHQQTIFAQPQSTPVPAAQFPEPTSTVQQATVLPEPNISLAPPVIALRNYPYPLHPGICPQPGGHLAPLEAQSQHSLQSTPVPVAPSPIILCAGQQATAPPDSNTILAHFADVLRNSYSAPQSGGLPQPSACQAPLEAQSQHSNGGNQSVPPSQPTPIVLGSQPANGGGQRNPSGSAIFSSEQPTQTQLDPAANIRSNYLCQQTQYSQPVPTFQSQQNPITPTQNGPANGFLLPPAAQNNNSPANYPVPFPPVQTPLSAPTQGVPSIAQIPVPPGAAALQVLPTNLPINLQNIQGLSSFYGDQVTDKIDIQTWLNRFDMHAELSGINEPTRIRLVNSYLEGRACEVYLNYVSPPGGTWQNLKEYLTQKLGTHQDLVTVLREVMGDMNVSTQQPPSVHINRIIQRMRHTPTYVSNLDQLVFIGVLANYSDELQMHFDLLQKMSASNEGKPQCMLSTEITIKNADLSFDFTNSKPRRRKTPIMGALIAPADADQLQQSSRATPMQNMVAERDYNQFVRDMGQHVAQNQPMPNDEWYANANKYNPGTQQVLPAPIHQRYPVMHQQGVPVQPEVIYGGGPSTAYNAQAYAVPPPSNAGMVQQPSTESTPTKPNISAVLEKIITELQRVVTQLQPFQQQSQTNNDSIRGSHRSSGNQTQSNSIQPHSGQLQSNVIGDAETNSATPNYIDYNQLPIETLTRPKLSQVASQRRGKQIQSKAEDRFSSEELEDRRKKGIPDTYLGSQFDPARTQPTRVSGGYPFQNADDSKNTVGNHFPY